jgi:thiol-disulfide isomerase/thioredoxin
LYFWDSECSHCKKITPALREAYNNLKEKDVKVFAMNVESDREKWLNYVEKNNLDWINVHDPVNTSGFRDIYDIFSIPIIFVLDADKKILAKKINPEQVKDVIQHYDSINK